MKYLRLYLTITVGFVLILFSSCMQGGSYNTQTKIILEELDAVILHKPEYGKIKEQQINSIKSLLRNMDTPQSVYGIYNNLYQEYYRYNLDSAMVYAKRKMQLANELNDGGLKDKSTFDIAEAFIMAGMLVEAKDLLDGVNFDTLNPHYRIDYYSAYHNLYREMKAISMYPSISELYGRTGDNYREKVYNLLEGDTIRKLFMDATL